MGAYSPVPAFSDALASETMSAFVLPTMRAMKEMGCPFKGILYLGLMLTAQGPKLIEYNVRFGDPECQVLMLRLMSDLVPALIASRDGQLKNFDLRWYDDAALVVAMATKGYPGSYGKGSVIRGLDAASALEGRGDLPRRHEGRGRTDHRQRWTRPEYLRHGQVGGRGAAARLCGGRQDRLAGGILPEGYWVSRACPGEAFRIAAACPCHQVLAR